MDKAQKLMLQCDKKSRLYQRCRKSSKAFSKEHTWLISMCDDKGNAVCAFCQARF